MTLHESYDVSEIIFTDEQQTILQLCTEQLWYLQIKVTSFPKSTFIIVKKKARKSNIMKETSKTDSD